MKLAQPLFTASASKNLNVLYFYHVQIASFRVSGTSAIAKFPCTNMGPSIQNGVHFQIMSQILFKTDRSIQTMCIENVSLFERIEQQKKQGTQRSTTGQGEYASMNPRHHRDLRLRRQDRLSTA